MNPFVYCTVLSCSDAEWENLSVFGAVILLVFALIGIVGGLVTLYEKIKGKDMK